MSSPSTANGVLPPARPTAPPPPAPAAPPSTNGGNGRDGRGRFSAGNRGGPGNPFARQTAALRRAFLAVVTPEDLEAIARMLLERARGGDLVAVKLLLLYAIGRPVEAVDPDSLDVQEWGLFQQSQASAEQLNAALGGLPLEVACPVVRAARGPIADACAAQLAQALKQAPAGAGTEAPAEEPAEVESAGKRGAAQESKGAGDASGRPQPVPRTRHRAVPPPRRLPGAGGPATGTRPPDAPDAERDRRPGQEGSGGNGRNSAWEILLKECLLHSRPAATPPGVPSGGAAAT
jgi:hypothetical protein